MCVAQVSVVRYHNMIDVSTQTFLKVLPTVLIDHLGTFYHKPVRLIPSGWLILKRGDLNFPPSFFDAHSDIDRQSVIGGRDPFKLGEVYLQFVVGPIEVIEVGEDQLLHPEILLQGNSFSYAQVGLSFPGFEEGGVEDKQV